MLKGDEEGNEKLHAPNCPAEGSTEYTSGSETLAEEPTCSHEKNNVLKSDEKIGEGSDSLQDDNSRASAPESHNVESVQITKGALAFMIQQIHKARAMEEYMKNFATHIDMPAHLRQTMEAMFPHFLTHSAPMPHHYHASGTADEVKQESQVPHAIPAFSLLSSPESSLEISYNDKKEQSKQETDNTSSSDGESVCISYYGNTSQQGNITETNDSNETNKVVKHTMNKLEANYNIPNSNLFKFDSFEYNSTNQNSNPLPFGPSVVVSPEKHELALDELLKLKLYIHQISVRADVHPDNLMVRIGCINIKFLAKASNLYYLKAKQYYMHILCISYFDIHR